jgi:hypothetical protein
MDPNKSDSFPTPTKPEPGILHHTKSQEEIPRQKSLPPNSVKEKDGKMAGNYVVNYNIIVEILLQHCSGRRANWPEKFSKTYAQKK